MTIALEEGMGVDITDPAAIDASSEKS